MKIIISQYWNEQAEQKALAKLLVTKGEAFGFTEVWEQSSRLLFNNLTTLKVDRMVAGIGRKFKLTYIIISRSKSQEWYAIKLTSRIREQHLFRTAETISTLFRKLDAKTNGKSLYNTWNTYGTHVDRMTIIMNANFDIQNF